MEEQTHIAEKSDEDLWVDVLPAFLPLIHLCKLGIPSIKNAQVKKDLSSLHKTLVDTSPIPTGSQSQSQNSSFTQNISYLATPMPTNRNLNPRFPNKKISHATQHPTRKSYSNLNVSTNQRRKRKSRKRNSGE